MKKTTWIKALIFLVSGGIFSTVVFFTLFNIHQNLFNYHQLDLRIFAKTMAHFPQISSIEKVSLVANAYAEENESFATELIKIEKKLKNKKNKSKENKKKQVVKNAKSSFYPMAIDDQIEVLSDNNSDGEKNRVDPVFDSHDDFSQSLAVLLKKSTEETIGTVTIEEPAEVESLGQLAEAEVTGDRESLTELIIAEEKQQNMISTIAAATEQAEIKHEQAEKEQAIVKAEQIKQIDEIPLVQSQAVAVISDPVPPTKTPDDDLVFYSSDSERADTFNVSDNGGNKIIAGNEEILQAAQDEISASRLLAAEAPDFAEEKKLATQNTQTTQEVQTPTAVPAQNPLLASHPLPNNVKEAINQEIKKMGTLPATTQDEMQKGYPLAYGYKASYGMYKKVTEKLADSTYSIARSERNTMIHKGESKTIIGAYSVRINDKTPVEKIKFDFSPTYARANYAEDRIENMEDEFDSKLIKVKLNESQSVIPGSLSSLNHTTTNIDLTIEQNEDGEAVEYRIPLMEMESFFNFVDKVYPQLNQSGGFVLMEVNNNNGFIDLRVDEDPRFNNEYLPVRRVCLDSEFMYKKLAKSHDYSECSYILFLGVAPGVREISMRVALNNAVQTISKLVYVPNEKIFFDTTDFIKSDKDYLHLLQERLVANKLAPFNNGDGRKLQSYTHENKKILRSNQGNNGYELIDLLTPVGTRHYIQILSDDNKGEGVYIGKQDATSLIIPEKEYRDYYWRTLGVRDSGCVVQINLPIDVSENDVARTRENKKLKAFYVDGSNPDNADDGLELAVTYLDAYGELSEDAHARAKKIFIVSDLPGAVTGRIDYSDGTRDYFQSFCYENTFMVEQF